MLSGAEHATAFDAGRLGGRRSVLVQALYGALSATVALAVNGVDQFVAAARAFLAFTHSANELELQPRMHQARGHLLALYAAGSELPRSFDVEAEHGVAEPLAASVIHVDFGIHDYYYEVFDPYVEGELVVGSLDDDFGDIARDLERGMAYWNAGLPKNAVWEWSFHFAHHWGDHAADALRALHRVCGPNHSDATLLGSEVARSMSDKGNGAKGLS